MRIAILTNEYPPHVYGGAGVHVEYLTQAITQIEAGRHQVRVFCFGDQEEQRGPLEIRGISVDPGLPFGDPKHVKVLQTLQRNLVIAGLLHDVDVVHCHTWYTHFAGCLVKQLTGAKLVLTTHSLEPHRPWKREQLGTGYDASTWIERTAYQNADGVVAVSESMREDVQELYGVPASKIRVIHNGIDLEQYHPVHDPAVLDRHGIDRSKPFVLFVGRITRQKGIIHLVDSIRHIRGDAQVVLLAGAPDTEEIEREMTEHVDRARLEATVPIHWIPKVLPKDEVIALYSQAALFVCPSVYEPFGIINLEAMACGTPVVASAVGGIMEVVVPEKTGLLVPFEPRSDVDHEPVDAEAFARDLAKAIDRLLASPELLQAMGERSRERVEHYFSWTSIARWTMDYYWDLVQGR